MENKNIKRTNRVIYSMKLASYLMGKGYPLIDVQINKKFTDKKVFFFSYSEEIEVDIQEYIDNNKR